MIEMLTFAFAQTIHHFFMVLKTHYFHFKLIILLFNGLFYVDLYAFIFSVLDLLRKLIFFIAVLAL